MVGDLSQNQWMPQASSTKGIVADFYSDTQTRPAPEMLEAMLDAQIGDVQRGEDPTTNQLCERVANLLGKEAAIFLPSGTMCNEIALRVHCDPGSEVICDRSSHIINFEAGGPAALGGIMMHPLDGLNGCFSADQVRAAVRPRSRYSPESRLVSVEQTTNMGGGGIWPLEQLQEVSEASKSFGLATHMDGARLFNACVATGLSPAEVVQGYDSCWIDFTKGLGGFAGAVLCGSRSFVNSAWRIAQQWGGLLRQSGVIAATGLYALDHHIERLAKDHSLAAWIGERLKAMPKVASVLPYETNIVIFNIDTDGPTAATVTKRLLEKGVRTGAFGERTIRIVTHLGVDRDCAELLCKHLPGALQSL